MKRIFLLCYLLVASALYAQGPNDVNEGSTLAPGSSGSYLYSWWGHPGRTYFVQQTSDLVAGSWTYLPLIESGSDQAIAWGFASTTNRLFLRLKSTDTPMVDPFKDDADGDGVSNWDELQEGTDPLSAKLDANGLPYDWESHYKIPFGTPSSNFAPVGNGLTLLQCFQQKLDPNNAPIAPYSIGLVASGSLVAPANVTLAANVGAATAAIKRVDFYQANSWLGSAYNSPWQFSLTGLNAGIYPVTAVSTDTNGATATGTASFTVSPSAPKVDATRYTRGWGTDPNALSSIIAVDFEKGILLDGSNNFSTWYPSGLPWFLRTAAAANAPLLHFYAMQSGTAVYGQVNYPVKVSGSTVGGAPPLVAFGSQGGGSPLYVNQVYNFGLAAGGQIASGSNDFLVEVYQKSSFDNNAANVAPILSSTFTLPRIGTPAWTDFAQNGYVRDFPISRTYNGKTISFDTHVQFVGSYIEEGWGQTQPWPMVISHKAGSPDFVFKVSYKGVVSTDNGVNWHAMAVDSSTAHNPTYNLTYSLDFDQASPWSSTYLNRPHFEGAPLPSAYQGKSLEELIHNAPAVADTLPVPTGNGLLTLDNSPELRTHPVLDSFVADMAGDPMALANYVLNEIELTDAMGYNANGPVSDKSINPTGVSRGALATFLEGQGSPAEQCALLVYLLRKAGTPCGYVFPQQDGMLMFDEQLSKLLRVQIRAAADDVGNTNTLMTIPVNYPWVAAYINGKWVHIFPWLKDTAVEEGYDLWSYMPEGYQSGNQWLRHYLLDDPTIRGLSSEGDNPGTLFPLWIQKQLQTSYPWMSIDDLGIKFYNRRNYFTRWEDFPRPWQTPAISGSNFAQNLDAAQNPNLTTVSLQNIFDTVKIQLFKDLGTGTIQVGQTPIITTGTMRMVDLHDRRMLIFHNSLGGGQYQVNLSLEAFRPSASSQYGFTNDPGDLLSKQVATATLQSSDDFLFFQIDYQRHRQLGTSFTLPDFWTPMLGFMESLSISDVRPLRKGDMVAFCMDYGRVSQKMQDFQAKKYWSYQQQVASNPPAYADPEQSTGQLLYLMGLSYFYKGSQFEQTVEGLTKTHAISRSAYGLAKLQPQRNSDDTPNLVNGDINLRYPAVDMTTVQTVFAGNGTSHLDSGDSDEDFYGAEALLAGEGSANEHRVLNQFFQQNGAVSTVKLLDLAQGANPGSGVVELNSSNYLTRGATNYTVAKTGTTGSVTKKLSDWAGPGLWGAVTSALSDPYSGSFTTVFMTPGPKTAVGQQGTPYTGMGAFIIAPGGNASLISDKMVIRGGASGDLGYSFYSYFPDTDLIGNSFLWIAPDNGYAFTNTQSYTSSAPLQVSTSVSSASQGTIANQLALGTVILDLTSYNDANAYATQSGQVTISVANGSAAAALLQTQANEGNPGTLCDNRNLNGGVWNGISNGVAAVANAVADPVNVITGAFYIDAVDLKLNGPMPLEIRRNYSSQSKADNSFGQYWKMSYLPYLALGYDKSGGGNGPFPVNRLFAAEADGSVIAYRLQPDSTYVPTTADNPNLANVAHGAPGGVGNVYNNRITVSGSNYVLNGADGSVRTFTTMAFPTSGSNSLVRSRPYLQTWTDSNGNSYAFTYGTDSSSTDYGQVKRIQSSNGDFVGFYYDTFGHIIEAYTGDGRRLTYTYDGFGDLTQVTLPDASTVNYTYQHLTGTSGGVAAPYSTHLLIQETKPGGRVLQNEYDSSGRVKVQRSTVGADLVPVQNASFYYGIPTVNADGTVSGTTAVTDFFGHNTTYAYSSGQITRVVDPSTYPVTQQWFVPGDGLPGSYPRSLKSRTDKRGLVANYQYDSKGNLVQLTLTGNLTGGSSWSESATTTMAYNSLNLLTSSTDAIGNSTNYLYADSAHPYLPTSIEKRAPSGSVSTSLLQYQDVVSGSTGAFGVPKQTTAAAGTSDESVVQFTYNANGFLTSKTELTKTGDPNVVTTYTHNLRGELTSETDAAGRATRYSYDALGNRTGTMRYDEFGSLVSWVFNYYNQNGEVEWTQGPRYSPDDYVHYQYDGAGRQAQVTKWRSQAALDGSGVLVPYGDAYAYAVTSYHYDGFGNLVEVDDPNQHATTMGYDSVGQMLSRTVHNGDKNAASVASESFTYEPGGKIATHITVLSGTESSSYTSTGLLMSGTMADGTAKSFRYDLTGRVVKETLTNGSYWSTAYDDFNRTVTRTFFNAGGTSLCSENQSFDRRGNLTSKTDAAGYTFTTTFDGLNRVRTTSGPPAAGNTERQTTTHTYDAAGLTHTITNAIGERSVTDFDALQRPILARVFNSNGSVASTVWNWYSPDHQSVVTAQGSGTNAVVTTVFTNTFGQTVLLKHANGSSQITQYDGNGNKTGFKDELGQITLWSYDALNHLASETLPASNPANSAVTNFTFNAAGQLLTRQMPGSLTAKTVYDNAGRKQSEELDGANSTVTRKFTYTYYTSGSWKGLLQSGTDPRGFTTTTTYDDYLRPYTVNSSGGAIAQQNQNTTYSYDARNLLTQVSQTYATGTTGPSTSVVRVYDGYGQISQETVSVSGTTVSQWNQSWDGAGRRSALNWQLAAQGGGAGSQYAMQYNGAGLLTQVTNSGSAYQFDYADNGLLQKRTTPLWTQTIVSRDGQGRVLSESVSARGITPVSETLTWRNDSRINSHAVVYSGSGALAPSESRTYGYDPRGRVVSEPFKLSGSQQSASYYFDQSAPGGAGSEGGLGVRTLQIFGGSYGYEVEAQNNFKQVTQDLNAPPGTAYSIVNQGYDALGSGTSRAIVNGQTQTLTWDGLGRLVSVKSRNASNNGNDWASVYDGLGRRVKTTQQTVTGGNPTGGISTLVYYYDPQVEFLQLGMSNQGVRTWNVYGPDANGVYGGQQGTGGLEAQVDETTGATTGMLGNYFGDVVGTVTSSNLSIPAIALGGYGPMPGSGVSSLAPAWRGRYLDWTGFYWMGARYYEPASGRFLSADPLGHGASMSLYDYANGDPVNGLDPDGRFGKMVGNGTKTDLGYGYDILNNVFYGTLAGGFKLAGAVDVGMQSGGATFDPQYSQWNQVAQAMESKYNLAEKAGWYTNNNLTAAVQNTATMVLPIFAGRFIPENPTLTGVGGTVDEAAGGSQLVVHQEQIIMNNYQRYYNDAWMQTVKRFNNGEITIPAGQSWQTTLGQYTDAAARARLQNYLQSAGIAEGPGTNVLVNRWLRDPSGSGAYRIPDVRLIQTGNILDGTIGNKTLLSPQVQDFIKFSNGNSVIIIRPTVGAGFGGG